MARAVPFARRVWQPEQAAPVVKIAIPAFGTRVSPRFDCAEAMLVVTLEDGRPAQRQEHVISDWAASERIARLVDWGVDTVVCGGIDCRSLESLQSAGVTIYGWVAGPIDEALAALVRGDLDFQRAGAGRGHCRCRRFAGRPGSGGGGRCHRGWTSDQQDNGTSTPPQRD